MSANFRHMGIVRPFFFSSFKYNSKTHHLFKVFPFEITFSISMNIGAEIIGSSLSID